MGGFVVYIPGPHKPKAETLAANGLEHYLRAKKVDHLTFLRVSRGPFDFPEGHVFAISDRVETQSTGYYPERQKWRIDPARRFAVGTINGEAITPEDLERPQTLPGNRLELADGREWSVPIARTWCESDDPEIWADWSMRLPRRLDLLNSGEWGYCGGGVVEEYARLAAIAEAFSNVALFGEFASPEDIAANEASNRVFSAVAVLSANYYIGPVEAATLGILTQHNVGEILEIATDMKGLSKILKKKARSEIEKNSAESPISCNGQEGTPPSIDQRSPTTPL